MSERIGGRTFYSPEESGPLDPEAVNRAEVEWEKRKKQLEQEAEQKKQGIAPAPRKPVSGRFGRDDFVGTEYEQWAKDAWAAEDARADNDERAPEGGTNE